MRLGKILGMIPGEVDLTGTGSDALGEWVAALSGCGCLISISRVGRAGKGAGIQATLGM
jgi:hypothetical protein